MTVEQFYDLTEDTFKKLVDLNEIKYPSVYFKQTDFDKNSLLSKLNIDIKDNNGLNFTFAQACFHMQNTSHGIGPFLEIDKFYERIKEGFFNFDVNKFANLKIDKENGTNEVAEIASNLIHYIVDYRDYYRKMSKNEIYLKYYDRKNYYYKKAFFLILC